MARVPGHTVERRLRPDRNGEWLGLGEASRLLGISEGTLRRWADDGRLAVFTTPGGHRRFSRHSLRSMLPAARAQRPALASLGASPERISRRYRTVAGRRHDEAGWLARLSEEERAACRDRGRSIVAALLAFLDADSEPVAEAALREAAGLAFAHGAEAAGSGATTIAAVEVFLQFRTPFIRSLAEVARRRGLDTREATELLGQAESAVDRLLLETMRGHAAGRAEADAPR